MPQDAPLPASTTPDVYDKPTRIIRLRPHLTGGWSKPAPLPLPDKPDRPRNKIIVKLRDVPEPTLAELAGNFGQAIAKWSGAGFKTVTKEQYDDRAFACEHRNEGKPCEFWDGDARLGLGKCKAPGCSCTKLKRWLATEECKHPGGSKWPKLTQPLPPSPQP